MTMMSSKKRTTRPVAAQPAQKQRRPVRRSNPWNPMGPLLVGLCFGLAYVVTGRLLEDRIGGLVPLGRRFSSKPVPGLTLESLRMRYGAERVNLLGPSPQLLPEPEPIDAAVLPAPDLFVEPESVDPSALPVPELFQQPEAVDSSVLPAPEIVESLELPLTDPLEDLPPWPQPLPQPPSSSATVGAPPPVWR